MSHQRRPEIIDINEDEAMLAFDLFDAHLSDSEDLSEQPTEEDPLAILVATEKSTVSGKAQEDMSVFKGVIVVEVEMNIMQSQSSKPQSTEPPLAKYASPYGRTPASRLYWNYNAPGFSPRTLLEV